MGDMADMMLDGTLCQVCGGVMPDLSDAADKAGAVSGGPVVGVDWEPPGYVRTCPECEEADDER